MHRRAITAVARGLCSYLAWMNDVRLLVWIAPRVTYALHSGVLIPTLRVLVSFNALAYPEHQVVAVRVNCQSITRFELSGAWQIYSFDLPENALPDAGPTLIELEHVKLLSASEHTNGQCPDQRPLAAAYTWFEFTPR